MRYLVYTTLAYGAEGISYYVYSAANHKGGMRNDDGTPTAIYEAVKPLNPEFVAIATELQPLQSLAVYHTTVKEPGCLPLPADAAFRPETEADAGAERGLLLGYFGTGPTVTHVLVVNLDYRAGTVADIVGPAALRSLMPPRASGPRLTRRESRCVCRPAAGSSCEVNDAADHEPRNASRPPTPRHAPPHVRRDQYSATTCSGSRTPQQNPFLSRVEIGPWLPVHRHGLKDARVGMPQAQRDGGRCRSVGRDDIDRDVPVGHVGLESDGNRSEGGRESVRATASHVPASGAERPAGAATDRALLPAGPTAR